MLILYVIKHKAQEAYITASCILTNNLYDTCLFTNFESAKKALKFSLKFSNENNNYNITDFEILEYWCALHDKHFIPLEAEKQT